MAQTVQCAKCGRQVMPAELGDGGSGCRWCHYEEDGDTSATPIVNKNLRNPDARILHTEAGMACYALACAIQNDKASLIDIRATVLKLQDALSYLERE